MLRLYEKRMVKCFSLVQLAVVLILVQLMIQRLKARQAQVVQVAKHMDIDAR